MTPQEIQALVTEAEQLMQSGNASRDPATLARLEQILALLAPFLQANRNLQIVSSILGQTINFSNWMHGFRNVLNFWRGFTDLLKLGKTIPWYDLIDIFKRSALFLVPLTAILWLFLFPGEAGAGEDQQLWRIQNPGLIRPQPIPPTGVPPDDLGNDCEKVTMPRYPIPAPPPPRTGTTFTMLNQTPQQMVPVPLLEDMQAQPTSQNVAEWERWFEDAQWRKAKATYRWTGR